MFSAPIYRHVFMQKTSGRQTHTHLISINGTTHRLKGGCKRNVPLLFIMGILFKKKCVPLYLHSNKMTNSKHIGKSPKAPMNPEPHETRPLPNSKFLFMRRVSNTTDKQLLFRKFSNLFLNLDHPQRLHILINFQHNFCLVLRK